MFTSGEASGRESPESRPFRMSKQELLSLDPNYQRPKKKLSIFVPESSKESPQGGQLDQTRLYNTPTISSKLKQRVSDNIDDLWEELETFGAAAGNAEDEEEEDDFADGEDGGGEGGRTEGDPTYELASARRNIAGTEPLSRFITNSRKMFMLQYSLSVKRNERQRLEKELRREEQILQRTESELRLAEQAFDQFLQDNDRKAVAAMKKAEYETGLRVEKATRLKQVDNRNLTLKREISKLKDSLAEYGTYQGFLFSLSPESWRLQQEGIVKPPSIDERDEDDLDAEEEDDGGGQSLMDRSTKSASSARDDEDPVTKILATHLGMNPAEIAKAKGEVMLYFHDPQELLEIFSDLEDENLGLIQECREAESNLEKIRTNVRETHARLTKQASNFQMEISILESKLENEAQAATDLMRIQEERANEGETAAEARRSADDKILKELALQVRGIFVDVVGEVQQEISTMELLKRIELRMEKLTQDLERLPTEKVKIAQRTCERERRHREHEAQLARQRQFEEERNRRALERALAPPFIKPELRKFIREPLVRKKRLPKRDKGSRSPSPPMDPY